MRFFAKRNRTGKPQPTRRSTLGFMFNPDIGDSIRPLGQVTSIFVQLIAMVFAMNGLFPKDHPALSGKANGAARLTLFEILSTAWAGLSFTIEGLPKVLLFVAVVGTMLMAGLSVITALLAGFVGTAHAQGAFSPVDPTQDLAQNWMNFLFFGQPLSNYYAQSGAQIPSGIGIQCSLMSALGFYSNSMLIFAAVILVYHLASMIASTAHEGVVMGKKANQIWAPIRLVVAVGLLVPVGSGPDSCAQAGGPGLNSGQYIVIQMAEWGSGMASQAWSVFLHNLSAMSYSYIPPSPPSVYGVVSDLVMMEACRADWNYHVCMDDPTNGGNISVCQNISSYTPAPGSASANEIINTPVPITLSTGAKQYIYARAKEPRNAICGSFALPPQPNIASSPVGATVAPPDASLNVAVAVYQAHLSAVNGFLTQVPPVGDLIVQYENSIAGIDTTADMSTNDAFMNLVMSYQQALDGAISGAVSGMDTTMSQTDADNMSAWGWPGAATFLNTIARNQGTVVGAVEDGLPVATAPRRDLLPEPYGRDIARRLAAFADWMEYGGPNNAADQPATAGSSSPCAMQSVAATGASTSGPTAASSVPSMPPPPLPTSPGKTSLYQQALNDPSFNLKKNIDDAIKALSNTGDTHSTPVLKIILDIVTNVATYSGVWKNTSSCSAAGVNSFNLGAQLVTANPLAELAFWGYANIRTSYALWDLVFQWSIAAVEAGTEYQINVFNMKDFAGGQPGLMALNLEKTFIEFVGSAFGLIALIFFACGFWAFLVPLMPYFRFFFNVLTWLASVLEAVVAIPLVALAHLNPEGEGLPGQSAKSAYFMIFNIFLRPVMTVFGLVAGLVLFYIAIMLLNVTYAVAVASTGVGNQFSELGILVRIIYTAIYASTAYVCANNCFKTIGMFPQYALKWIGQQAHHEAMGDGGQNIKATMGQAGGFMGEKGLAIAKLKPPTG